MTFELGQNRVIASKYCVMTTQQFIAGLACIFALLQPPARASAGAATGTEGVSSAPAYVFTYFTGNGEDGLHLATSTDGYHWETLNGGRSYLKPLVGESKLMRDPCVLLGPDGTFHLVWTTAWAGKTVGYANSKDLAHWSPQRALSVMTNEPATANCWAPEIAYDEQRREFVIFWSSTIAGKYPETLGTAEQKNNHRIYRTTTRDFQTFSPAQLFFDPGFVVIDATFLRTEKQLWLIFKDETLKPERKYLRMVKAAGYEGPFTDLSAPFTPGWVEGPTALKVGEDYVVYFDCYRDHHYGAVRSPDLKTWEDVTARLSFPKAARHGTIIAMPAGIINALRTLPPSPAESAGQP